MIGRAGNGGRWTRFRSSAGLESRSRCGMTLRYAAALGAARYARSGLAPNSGCGMKLSPAARALCITDGEATRSCTTRISAVAGRNITTISKGSPPMDAIPVQTGVARSTGGAVRLLPGGHDYDDRCAAGEKPRNRATRTQIYALGGHICRRAERIEANSRCMVHEAATKHTAQLIAAGETR